MDIIEFTVYITMSDELDASIVMVQTFEVEL